MGLAGRSGLAHAPIASLSDLDNEGSHVAAAAAASVQSGFPLPNFDPGAMTGPDLAAGLAMQHQPPPPPRLGGRSISSNSVFSPAPLVSPRDLFPLEPVRPVAPVPDLVSRCAGAPITPPAEHELRFDDPLAAASAAVFAPCRTAMTPPPQHAPLPPPPAMSDRRDPGLRLPCFETLGIAAPHSDRFDGGGLGGHASVGDAIAGGSPEVIPVSEAVLGSGLVGAVDSMDLEGTGMGDTVASSAPGPESGVMSHGGDGTTSGAGEASSGSVGVASPERPWLDRVVSVLLENIPRPTDSISVLSHALPSPSPTGHVYTSIVAAMHQSTPGADTVWVNVFHAIPGRFNLEDMPTSPPATPAPVGAGQDYFTSKTFDSAVSIADYQTDLSRAARSPRPVVRPSSIDISIVERYIPPTNSNEFAGLFDADGDAGKGPSILVDRLIELSPASGALVFIYPTRAGARAFMRQYLSPVIDRALRSMAVVHNFPADFGRLVGTMDAVEDLLSHEAMDRRMRTLCERLSRPDSLLQRYGRGGGNSDGAAATTAPRTCRLEMALSTTARVPLGRDAWARDWWARQEKPRIRRIVARFADDPQRRVDDPAATPIVLLQQLLDDVVRKDYAPGAEPREGVEVSVFVLRRRLV